MPAAPDIDIDIVIYHNPACATSRTTLAMIRNAGIEPHVAEYLLSPPGRAQLQSRVRRLGVPVRELLRAKEPAFQRLGLDDPGLHDEALVEAMLAHPVLINRPIVVSPLGAVLCRSPERVLDLLAVPQRAAFTKEGGGPVVDAQGKHAS